MALARCPNCQRQHFTLEDPTVLFRDEDSVVLTCPKCFASVEFLRDRLSAMQSDSARLVDKPDERPKLSVSHPGSSPLYWAAAANASSLIERLVNHGADPNCREGTNGATPLHLAVLNEANDALTKLLELGAEGNVSVLGSGTPLELAAANGYLQITKTLIESGSGGGKWGDAMKKACENGFDEVLRVLLESGANPNPSFINGKPPLKKAVSNGSANCFFLLLDFGAEIKEEEIEWYLFSSISTTPILKHIVTLDISPNYQKQPKLTSPLHRASEGGYEESITVLIDNGADVNVQNKDGTTPLHEALWSVDYNIAGDMYKDFSSPKYKCVKKLIKNGADPEIENSCGVSPITWAIKEKSPYKIIRYLFENGSNIKLAEISKHDITDVLYGSVVNDDVDVATKLLNLGADVNGRVKKKDTGPLSKNNYTKHVSEYKMGNHKNTNNEKMEWLTRPPFTNSYVSHKLHYSPLQIAIEKKNINMAEMLLNYGASIRYVNDDNETPISLSKGKPKMEKLIQKYIH